MKLITLNQACIGGEDYILDLQTAQIPGHRPYPYWTVKYQIAPKKVIALTDVIYNCWMGKQEGIMGAQYRLANAFQDVKVKTKEKLPIKLKGFPDKNELIGKKILCVLAHPGFGLSDLSLSMPFLKVFAQSLKLDLGLSINSAGLPFFYGQNWLKNLHPELLSFEEFIQYDYYLEPLPDNKMTSLSWIRNYLLKELGENIFYERFPSPELKIDPQHIDGLSAHLRALPGRNTAQKICLLSWESSSQRRNLPIEVIKQILKSLQIMDYQIAVTKPVFRQDNTFEWLIAQSNVVNASSLIDAPGDILELVSVCDLVIGPDTSALHLAGGLRKRGLCIFMKSAEELYGKYWLKGSYWPGKLDKLYPSIKGLFLPHAQVKNLDKILHQAIRLVALGEDPEMLEQYNNLLHSLRNQHLFNDLENLLKRKPNLSQIN